MFLKEFAEKKAQPVPSQAAEEAKELIHKAIEELTKGVGRAEDWDEGEIREVSSVLKEIGRLVGNLKQVYDRATQEWKVV